MSYPCPFCRSAIDKVEVRLSAHQTTSVAYAVCTVCDAQGPRTQPFDNDEDAKAVAMRLWQEGVAGPKEPKPELELYRERLEGYLEYHKERVRRGLTPMCGLRLSSPGSSSVVPMTSKGGEMPFAQFSLDSRSQPHYEIAHEMAVRLLKYVEKVGG